MRKLNSQELNFLALTQANGNANTSELIFFDCILDAEEFYLAVIKSIKQYDVLESTIHRKWPFYFWKKNKNLPLSIKRYTKDFTTDQQAIEFLTEFLWSEPIDPFSERLIRFNIVEYCGKCCVQVLSSHVLADAKSCASLVKDICMHYGKFEEQTQITNHEAFVMPLTFIKRAILGVQLLFNMISELFYNTAYLPKSNIEKGKNVFYYHQFSSKFLPKLLDIAKQNQVTLHTVLTCYLSVIYQKPNEKLKILDTFSLHRYFGQNEKRYGLFMIPYGLKLKNKGSKNLELTPIFNQLKKMKNGAIYKEVLRQKIYGNILSISPKFMMPFLVKLVGHLSLKGNLILSNLGVSDPWFYGEQAKQLKLKDYIIYSVCLPPGRLALAFNTYNNKLRVTAVTDSNLFNQSSLADSFNKLEQLVLAYQPNLEEAFSETVTVQ